MNFLFFRIISKTSTLSGLLYILYESVRDLVETKEFMKFVSVIYLGFSMAFISLQLFESSMKFLAIQLKNICLNIQMTKNATKNME